MSGKQSASGASSGPGLFVGFDAFADQFSAGSVAGAAQPGAKKGGAAPVYTGNDAEVAQILKRLNKKSATTKVKALSDLSVSFAEKPKGSLRDIAAVWAYHCPSLAYYPDTRVRRAVSAAFLALVSRSKSVVGEFAGDLVPAALLLAQDGDRDVHVNAQQITEALLPSTKAARILGKIAKRCIQKLRDTAVVSNDVLQERLALGEQDAEESCQRARLAAVRSLSWVVEQVLPLEDSASSEQSAEAGVSSPAGE